MLTIGWVEVQNIARTARRNVIEELQGEIAVPVGHVDTLSGLDVLEDHVPQKCGFARARLAHNVRVLAPVTATKSQGRFTAPAFALPDLYKVLPVHGPEQVPSPRVRHPLCLCESKG